ncbi:cellulose binding domain-containing protein [Streptomyces sp. NPDC059070]|uniref:cellulose binding domain-containing protein n=1 Tax=Streptomyces sp. NPDC059070 TaxID=3346713 RepID=UPI0036A9C17E
MRRSLTLLLALFATLALFVTAPPAGAAGGVLAVFAKTSDWGTGYQAGYTVTNNSSAGVNGWTVGFDLPSGSTVGSYWDALLKRDGDHYSFSSRDYNGSVAPGASAGFGFLVSGGGLPANCTLNGASCDSGSGGPAPSVPAGVTVGSPTGSSLTVRWTASTGGSGAVSYEVSQGGAAPVAASGTSYTATGLQPDTTYSFRVRAKDAAGNTSAYGDAVSGTTSGSGGPAPGAVRTAPYVDMGAWPTPSLAAASSASGLNSFTLAFITASNCKAMWFNAYDPRTGWAKDQIDAVRAAGGDVKVSFGGASGVELAQACTDVNALYTEYAAVVDAYHLTYADSTSRARRWRSPPPSPAAPRRSPGSSRPTRVCGSR